MPSTSGPRPDPGAAQDRGDLTLAADLGGTHVRAGLVDVDGSLLAHRTLDTPRHDLLPTTLVDLLERVSAGRRPARTVVAVPGPVDYRTGRLAWAPHLPSTWVEELTEAWLADALGHPVALANDADAAAVGEAAYGAARDRRDVVYLTVSTGIGAGVVLGGKLTRGHRSIAEIGHTVVDREAWREGRPSTVEELGSGSAIPRLTGEAGLGEIDGHRLEEAAADGDGTATVVWHRVVEVVAIAVANLTLLFEPEVVVLGGGMGRRPRLLDGVRQRLEEHRARDAVPLVGAELGDDAGLIGAAAWRRMAS